MTKSLPATGESPRARSFNARFNRALSRVLEVLKVDDIPHIKRITTTVVGGTVILIGVAMFFLPGPGLLVAFGGLAILGTEYAWARRWLRRGRMMAKKALTQTQKVLGPTDKVDALGAKLQRPHAHPDAAPHMTPEPETVQKA